MLGLAGLGYRYRFSLNLRHRSVHKVLTLMVPRSIDQGIDQLHYTIETIIGSRLATGSLTAYYYANNLKNVPLVVFGSAIATASFPRLAARAAKHNKQALIEDFVSNARLILFLVIPSAILAVLMRGYIVRLLFGFGDPTTANTLGWFAGTIVFQSLFFLVARVFYALQDTRTPLYGSLFAIALNIGLSLILSARYGVAGLAMATSIAVTLETLALLIILQRKLGNVGVRQILRGVGSMVLSATLMGSLVYIMVARLIPLYRADLGFLVVGPKFAAITLVAVLAYLLPCYFLGLKEAKYFIAKLKEQALKPLNLN
jgi:putative peptidoglycan lipid II flippase